jgi:hypothetical protein
MKLLKNAELNKSSIYSVRVIYLILFLITIFLTKYSIILFHLSILFLIPVLILLVSKQSYRSNQALITCTTAKWIGMILSTQVALYLLFFGVCGLSNNIILPPYHDKISENNFDLIRQLPLFPWPYITALVTIILAYIPQAKNFSIFDLFAPQLKSNLLRAVFTHGIIRRYEMVAISFATLAIAIFVSIAAGVDFYLYNNVYILVPIAAIFYLFIKNDRLHGYLYKNSNKLTITQQIYIIIIATACVFMLTEVIMQLSGWSLFKGNDYFSSIITKINFLSASDAWRLIIMSMLLLTGSYLSLLYIRISQGRKIISTAGAILTLPLLIFLSGKYLHLDYIFNKINSSIPLSALLTVIGSFVIVGVCMQKEYRHNAMEPIQINTESKPKKRSSYAFIQSICKLYPFAFITFVFLGFGLIAAIYTILSMFIIISLPIFIWLSAKAPRQISDPK